MQCKKRCWLLAGLICLLAAGLWWYLGRPHQEGERRAGIELLPHEPDPALGPRNYAQSMPLLSLAAMTNAATTPATNAPKSSHLTPLLAYRLTNTPEPLTNLMVSESAVLLRNALIDTKAGQELPIPAHLKSEGDPGSYIVQAHGPVREQFHDVIAAAGAKTVSYIPNNAFLVRGSEAAANALRGSPMVAAVLPWEPYYKLDLPLLEKAVKQEALPPHETLTVLLFPGERAAGIEELRALGAKLGGEDRSPFGHAVVIYPQPDTLAALARLKSVQSIEQYRGRQLANDLARVRVGVSTNTVIAANYLGLSGSNIVMGVIDTGVQESHPDLLGRVFGVTNDVSGHGTHVAGIMASSGANGPDGAKVPGSVKDASFRGMAPASTLFSLPIDLVTGPLISDAYLQETVASTNVLISNNSWGYPILTYNLAAASYDAAVRDALPEQTGPRPLIFVFAAGNVGNDSLNGGGGAPDQIYSPATSKNGIAVGALENPRFITNEVVVAGVTNQGFYEETDSFDQVAFFSSRGNVGVGVEGDFGRFKPDLVAPGAWMVSARSTNWVDPTNALSGLAYRYVDEFIAARGTNFYSIPVPVDAVEVLFRILPNTESPANMPALNIHTNKDTRPVINGTTFVGTNFVTFPVTPGDWWVGVHNTNLIGVHHDIQVVIWRTNDFGTYFDELRKLNEVVGPNYRYESGTSMAAPVVSGVLGLMQEFFEQRLLRTNSPAMMKALLINGARSLNCSQCPNPYDLQVRKPLNHQGWGLVSLTNSLPRVLATRPQSEWPIIMLDQHPNRGLKTGDSHTYEVNLTSRGQFDPLRITLVWTDPPGNPAVGVKLVNDLDLIVTNMVDNELVYIGNNIGPGADFNQVIFASESNAVPYDVVNNVENVFISSNQRLSSRYSVTVRAKRVNVNAVTTQTNGVLQDYALVISSGNSVSSNVFTLTQTTNHLVSHDASPFVQNLTNKVALFNQRVGANSPLFTVDTNNLPGPNNGVTNQWNFYVFENTNANFTNVAIFTFLPPDLAVPRNKEADIDLYVSFDPGLTNLEPAVIRAAPPRTYTSLGRGGTEIVIFTNETRRFFHVGVKAEDQQAAQFAIFVIAQERPFGEADENGNYYLELIPAVPGGLIADGSPMNPGGARFLGIGPNAEIRRMVLTNDVFHQRGGDLLGNLTKLPDNEFVVLNNHRPFFGGERFVYDDSEEADYDWAQTTDGPGSLRDFAGKDAFGVWYFTMIDNANSETGYVAGLWGLIEPQIATNDPAGVLLTVDAYRWRYLTVDVPVGVTNFTVSLAQEGSSDPLDLYLRRINRPTAAVFDKMARIAAPGGSLSLSRYDVPALQAGRYQVGISNPNAASVSFRVRYDFQYSLAPLETAVYYASNSLPLIDDAKITSTITVTNARAIADVKVGVRIDHPRISDLALRLISPQGTRILLAENRGGIAATNYGGGTQTVYYAGANFNGGPAEFRTNIDVKERQGIVRIDATFFEEPDSLRIYYDGERIFDSGMVSWTNIFDIPFGPGLSTNIVIVVNEGGNSAVNTAWRFNATITSPWSYAVFTDLATLGDPIKFAFPEFYRTPENIVVFSNSFEGAFAGEYNSNAPPFLLEGWRVRSNDVAILVNTNVAQHGSNYLALSHGAITASLTNVFPDREYLLSFAQKKVSSSPTQSVVLVVTNHADINTAVSTNPPPPGFVPAFAVPKMRLCPGQELRIAVSTNLADFGNSGPHRAHGDTNQLDLRGIPLFSLMGCWSSHPNHLDAYTAAGQPFYIGTNSLFAAPNEPGDYYLFLGVNDPTGSWDNNTGTWALEITWNHCQLASGFFELGNTPVHFWGSPKTNWNAETLRFIGNPTLTNLTLRPDINTTLLFDHFEIQEVVRGAIYQTEEPMTPLQAEYAFGDWKLEVWDLRAGPTGSPVFTSTNANGTLLSWSLNFIFADGPGTIPLTNNVPVDHYVRFDEVRYFQVAVPREVKIATNYLFGNGVELMFSPHGLPEGISPPDPIPPFAIPNPFVLSNNPPPNLGIELPVGRLYYLAVRNTNPGNPSNNFAIRTDFDILPRFLPNGTTIGPIDIGPSLWPYNLRQAYQGLAVSNTHYYYFDIPNTNVISSVSRLNLNLTSSNLHLVLRRALPVVDLFPHETFYDYHSTESRGIDEVILVNSNSIPVNLAPGRWYLGVYNTAPTNARYSINVTNSISPRFRFTDLVMAAGTNLIVTNIVGETTRTLTSFYRFVADQTNAAVLFELYGMNRDLDLIVRRSDLPFPELYEFGVLSDGPKATIRGPVRTVMNLGYEPIPVRTNIFIPHLNATNWFLQVLYRGAGRPPAATLAIKVFTNVNPIVGQTFTAYITPPEPPNTNDVTLCWDAVGTTTYTIEQTTNFTTWTTVISNVVPCFTIPNAPPATYYRVRAD